MNNEPAFELHRHRSNCNWTTGRVVGLTERRTTTVSGSSTVTSRTDVEIEFFLNDGLGDHGPFQTTNWRVPLRNGQLVTWINGDNGHRSCAVALINHTTGQWQLLNSEYDIAKHLGGYRNPGWKAWILLMISSTLAWLGLMTDGEKLDSELLGLSVFIGAFFATMLRVSVLQWIQSLRIQFEARHVSVRVRPAVEMIRDRVSETTAA